MFETLSKGFRAAKQRLTGKAELDDAIIDEALRDVRLSLLEGDVEFRVVKRFMERVREAARGEQVKLKAKSEEYGVQRITPEQAFIKICQDELTKMMGPVDTELTWAKKGATGIMMVGLQGSGKTTSVRQARPLPREGPRQEGVPGRRRRLPPGRRRSAQDPRRQARPPGVLDPGRRPGHDLQASRRVRRQAGLRRRSSSTPPAGSRSTSR
jgi:hypothetical protein